LNRQERQENLGRTAKAQRRKECLLNIYLGVDLVFLCAFAPLRFKPSWYLGGLLLFVV
jgi:hypothetical protein